MDFCKKHYIGRWIVAGLGLWVSQIIFSVLYSTQADKYLGIPRGAWTQFITPAGYEQVQLYKMSSSRPTALEESVWDRFQDECRFGKGQCTALWAQQLLSQYRWLDTIQYIAKDVDIQKPSDLTNRFKSIADIAPQWIYPYQFAQSIGPSFNRKNPTDADRLTRANVIALGEQGISYSCDSEKIERISQLTYEEFIDAIETRDERYRYPCQNDELAHALAFNYYYYLDDNERASLYYMIAAFHDDVPLIAVSMPAILMGRDGNNKTSAFLRYSRLQSAYKNYDTNDHPHDQRRNLEDIITKSMQESVKELSLYMITMAMQSAQDDGKPELCLHDTLCLQNAGYIRTVLTDLQTKCSTDKITCEIINLGLQSGRITPDGKLIHPDAANKIYYLRDKERNLWESRVVY